jgi:hypothetical protein
MVVSLRSAAMRSEPWGFIAKLAQTDSPGIAQLNRRRTTYIALHKKDKVFFALHRDTVLWRPKMGLLPLILFNFLATSPP